jgi:drug/metabolite transporter (DMT)-like permease
MGIPEDDQTVYTVGRSFTVAIIFYFHYNIAMSSLAFALIIISSIMHALWNLLVKRSRHKTVFIWWMFISSTLLFTATLPLLPGPFPLPDRTTLLLGAGGSFCFVLYHLFNGRAYRSGDLSLTYPLSQTSMLYVPLWGIWLLGERLSLTGSWGILLVAAGAGAVQMRKLTLGELLRPFRNLGDASVQAALAAGFAYSLGAVADKSGVERYSPLYFTYILVLFMLILLSANLLRPRYRPHILAEWRENRLLILASGPIMMGSFLTFRYGLSLSPMSYAVPVRQVSVLAGVLIGVVCLGEPCGRVRLLAAALIISGVFLIRLG